MEGGSRPPSLLGQVLAKRAVGFLIVPSCSKAKSVSGGHDAWLMSIRVARDFLPSDKLTHPFVRTLVLWDEPKKNPLIAHYEDADEKYRLNDGTKAKPDRKRMSLIGIASGRRGKKG